MNSKLPIYGFFFLLLYLSSCAEKIDTPEKVLTKWLIHKNNGDCENAFELELKPAAHMTADPNCKTHELEIISIKCIKTEETADCYCLESRNQTKPAMYNYHLKKVDGRWGVHRPD